MKALMKALMDLKTDYAFKQLFGQPGTTAFLNPRFQREAAEGIFAVDLANTEIAPSRRLGPGKRLDIYAHQCLSFLETPPRIRDRATTVRQW